MRWNTFDRRPTVAVIGLGYVGSCLTGVLSDRGHDVIGVDTDTTLVNELARGHCRFREEGLPESLARGLEAGRVRFLPDQRAVGEADTVLITVGTPVREDGSLAVDQLARACDELSRHLRRDQLVIVKSTVPPGTTSGRVRACLERSGLVAGEDFGLAFAPERLAEGTAMRELRGLPMVVGGLEAQSTRAAADFWRRGLGVEVITVGSPEAAEIVKLADNWWIDLNIAMANELARYCELFGVDAHEVIPAANTVPKGSGTINVLTPSVGVGGSCLTKDPWMVWHSARERGLELRTPVAGREANTAMPDHAADTVLAELERMGHRREGNRVAVLGLSFKNDTGDLRETPALPFVTHLEKAGTDVVLFDPLVDPGEALRVFGREPAPSLKAAVADADCVAVLAYHRELAAVDLTALPVPRPCLFFDGRAHLSREYVERLRASGFVYRGIGR
ncbi:nucleotide sugar dehydrogenase [Nocardiopsis exhalans]|uniref:Nucleotide sugar dehydrogenase n=1 Tax=Nocardiopsis exhalans TaxID=163604 RepID=A0ABY5D0V4_9ACTN|nr:nucleotide sugar dehydrogenase [Nocardiopsis exhalans]USY17542.1 nucleotide sugar dehydrogenase [Nocardiopsis exhalans]